MLQRQTGEMANLIEQKHRFGLALKARPMIWHSTSLTFQKDQLTKNDDSTLSLLII
jgi:hypothetical protein